MTVDDWAGDPFCFCKPVAKTPEDRASLLRAVARADAKFFFGSDSAPHLMAAKSGGASRRAKAAAGVFTQPYATQLVLGALEWAIADGMLQEHEVTREKLEGFLNGNGMSFYGIPSSDNQPKIRLSKGEEVITDTLRHDQHDVEVVPFRSGEKTWTLEWI